MDKDKTVMAEIRDVILSALCRVSARKVSQNVRRDLPRVSRKNHKPQRGVPRHRQPTSRTTKSGCKKGKKGDSSSDDGGQVRWRKCLNDEASLKKTLKALQKLRLRLQITRVALECFTEVLKIARETLICINVWLTIKQCVFSLLP